jgi:UDP-N-acetyl-alpha-D-muramoyl-L-alanyl-L-glutamate epimerase
LAVSDEIFTISKPEFEPATGLATFRFTLNDWQFIEHVSFGEAHAVPPGGAFERLMDLAAVAMGTSYFKLRAPFRIDLRNLDLSSFGQRLVLDIYENGLGEFYATNNLKRFDRLELITHGQALPAPLTPKLANKSLVLIGGGKDSIVSADLMGRAGLEFTPFAVNPKGPILSTVAVLDRTPIYVTRRLDPAMIALTKRGDTHNGHIPVTAINSTIAALAAFLFGYYRIILSNERSADEGNVDFDGRTANHQHSKSLAFEKILGAALDEATGRALGYFSLLRPYSEARIGALFARTRKFDGSFSSCNRNFRLAGHEGDLWCGACPKCYFVFLMLGVAMDRVRITAIFSSNLLDRAENIAPYRELTGLSGHKPWECVGEILEAAATLWHMAQKPDWTKSVVAKTLAPELEAFYGRGRLTSAWADLFVDAKAHQIPADLFEAIRPHAA